MLLGIVAINSFTGFPYIGDIAGAAGIAIFFVGLIIAACTSILLLKLAYDTWKIETNVELRARYGRSIKWGILITFLFPVIPFLWVLLVLGYFSKARLEAEKLAAQRPKRMATARGRRGPAFEAARGKENRVH